MRKSRIPPTQKQKKEKEKKGESLTLKCWEIQTEPNFSLFGIPEVKPYIQCHPENQRESQVCVPATAVIKRQSLKARDVTRITIAGNLPQGTFTQSKDLTLYFCQNIRETVFP